MDILASKSDSVIRKSLWERLLSSIHNSEVAEIAEQFGEFYLGSIKHGERAFGYDKNSDLPLFAQREAKIKQMIEGKDLPVKDNVKLLDIAGMMHNLYEMAELKAAFNSGAMQKIVDDTVNTLSKDLSLEQILEHIKTVEVCRILTAHPTFVGKLPYAVLMRDLQNAIFAEDNKKIDECLLAFNDPEFSAVVDQNLTPADEAEFMTHYLLGIAESGHELYRMFDKALKHRFGNEYNPPTLELKTRYGDWGTSGDKDGNQNITAASLNKAIPERRKASASRFISIIDKLSQDSQTTEFKARLGRLENLNPSETAKLREDLEGFFKQRYESEESGKSAALQGLREVRGWGVSLGHIEFRETAELLEHVIGRFLTEADVKKLSGVAGKKYAELSDVQKQTLLNNLLEPKSLEVLKSKIASAMKDVPEEAKASDYQYKDTGGANNAIFYNTISRLQTAAANPDMFPSHVLAEAEKPLQLKEMLVLLKALGLEKQILIIPLFEEPEILLDLENILEEIISDKVFYNYLVEYCLERFKEEPKFDLGDELEQRIRKLDPSKRNFHRDKDAIGKDIRDKTSGRYGLEDVIYFEFQLAHSDNTRRGGTTAARGGIGDGHRIGNEVTRKYGLGCHIYEGGSQTDSMRKGGKSFRAQLNMQGTYNFIKDTVQGIDIFALLNSVQSTTAYIGEILCHGLLAATRWNGKEHITPARRRQADFTNSATPIQQIVNSTAAQLEYYQDIHFAHSRLAEAMDQIFEYSQCRDAGTVGSRAGERVAVEQVDKKKSLSTDATKVRTIGYSESGQHAYCHFGFIGGGNLRQDILGRLKALEISLVAKSNGLTAEENGLVREGKNLIRIADARKTDARMGLTMEEAFDLSFLTVNKGSNDYKLHPSLTSSELAEIAHEFDTPVLKSEPELLHSLYNDSPLFRDIVDRNGNAVASSTDFDKVWNKAMSTGLKMIDEKGQVVATVHIERRPSPDELEKVAEEKHTMRGYLAGLEIECRKASHLVIEAMTGKPFELSDKTSTIELKLKVRELMRDKGKLHAGDAMHSFADVLKSCIPEKEHTDKVNTAHHHLVDLATLHPPTPQPVMAMSKQFELA